MLESNPGPLTQLPGAQLMSNNISKSIINVEEIFIFIDWLFSWGIKVNKMQSIFTDFCIKRRCCCPVPFLLNSSFKM